MTPRDLDLPEPHAPCTRAQFLLHGMRGAGALALAVALPSPAAASDAMRFTGPSPAPRAERAVFDLREFGRWIRTELEPSVRRAGGAGHYARNPRDAAPELYGVSDMACILHTLGELHPTEPQRAEWAAAFQQFQRPDSGWLIEKSPTHDALHNTAFALGAMELLALQPRHKVTMEAAYADPRPFLAGLDWRARVYSDSHKGAGIGSIHALVRELHSPEWFERYFAFCDSMFESTNGMMGRDKPAGGDSDQIGGTFHYHFLYEHFNRPMPFPERRIDSIIGLQQADGYWHPTNHLWLTLDAIYLMTRTLRFTTHRFADVRAVVRRTMEVLMRDVYSPAGRSKLLTDRLAVHLVTAAISIAAEAQRFLGAHEVVTERPLHLVLDRRPFI